MRKPVLALAAAGSVFALTAAGAAGVLNAGSTTKSLPTLAKQTVTLNTCAATSAEFSYTTSTTEATYGQISEIVFTLKTAAGGVAADLDNCNKAVVTATDTANTPADHESTVQDLGTAALVSGSGGTAIYARTVTLDSGDFTSYLPTDSLGSIKAVVTAS